jgi:hypothetical protein
MAKTAKAALSVRPQLPGDVLNVSRIEHDSLASEVVHTSRRFDRNDLRMSELEREITDLKQIVHALQAEHRR